MPGGAQAGGHFQGDTAVLRPSEGRPAATTARAGRVPAGQHQPAPLPRCKRVPFSTRTPLAARTPGPALASTLGPARWVRTRTAGQTGSAVPREGSFRLLLSSPRLGPHGPSLRVWSRQGTADPGSLPFRCFPAGKEGASQCSGSLHLRGPSRCPHTELLRPSPRPGTTHLLLSLQMCLFWTSLINGHRKRVLLCFSHCPSCVQGPSTM